MNQRGISGTCINTTRAANPAIALSFTLLEIEESTGDSGFHGVGFFRGRCFEGEGVFLGNPKDPVLGRLGNLREDLGNHHHHHPLRILISLMVFKNRIRRNVRGQKWILMSGKWYNKNPWDEGVYSRNRHIVDVYTKWCMENCLPYIRIL